MREKDFMQQEIRESLHHCQEQPREKEQLQGPLSQINEENLSLQIQETQWKTAGFKSQLIQYKEVVWDL